MSYLDKTSNVLAARALLWGPDGGGKTAFLQAVRRLIDPEDKLRLYTIDGLFDVLPLEDFTYGSYRVRARIMALSRDDSLHRQLLQATDVVLFVADSSPGAAAANRDSLCELTLRMQEHGMDPVSVPIVFCANHRDLPDAMPLSEMASLLGGVQLHEVVASEGRGVFECFTAMFRALMDSVSQRDEVVGPENAASTPGRLLPQLVRGGKISTDRPATAESRTLRIELPEGQALPVEAMIRLAEEHVSLDQLHTIIEGRNRELMAINRVARSILSAMEPDNLLVVLLDAIADYLGVTHASCVVFDPTEEGRLRSHVHGFGRDPVLGLPHKDARYLFDLIQSSDGPIPASDRHNPELLKALRRVDRRIQRALFQSVRGNSGRAAGWLGIYTTAEEAPLTTQRLLFLSSISRLAALGLEKIDMVERMRSDAADLEATLGDSTAKLEMAKARIRALNRGMESRVTERTQALQESVRALKEKRAAAVHEARLEGTADVACSFAQRISEPISELGQGLKYMRERLDELRSRAPDAIESLEDFDAILEESHARTSQIEGMVAGLQRFGSGHEEDEVDLNAAVADALTLLDDRVTACVDVELRLGSIPTVRGDSRELGHVVLALITNSVESIEKQAMRGRLVVSTFVSQNEVTLLVQDTGVGIDEALQPRIFEPFVTSKTSGGSVGLGLYTAHRAVKRHGGVLKLTSKPGEGTSAKVVLAVEPVVNAEVAADASADAARSSRRPSD